MGKLRNYKAIKCYRFHIWDIRPYIISSRTDAQVIAEARTVEIRWPSQVATVPRPGCASDGVHVQGK